MKSTKTAKFIVLEKFPLYGILFKSSFGQSLKFDILENKSPYGININLLHVCSYTFPSDHYSYRTTGHLAQQHNYYWGHTTYS